MLEPDLLTLFPRRLEELGVPYMASGSLAIIVYGAPRMTHDVDLIVTLNHEHIHRLQEVFPPSDFYCPPVEVILEETARECGGHINLIHHASGFKADLYLSGRDPLHAWGMARARHFDVAGATLVVAPPEYVIVRKLEYYREGGSEKHLRDIRSMLDSDVELVDQAELDGLLAERGLSEAWTRARDYR